MINPISSNSSTYGLSGTTSQNTNASASASELIASFKDILSTMMLSGGASDGQASSSISDMMAPLMMLILLDKLMEGQVGQSDSTLNNTLTNTLTGSIPSQNQTPQNQPSGRPVAGGVVSQGYHNGHIGLDLAVPTGTPVKATMDGKVIYAGWNNQGYGNLVIIQNGEYKTYYAHLSSIPVAVGATVTSGSTIGLSGNTGNSTGPHLHYEIRRNNVAINPTAVTLGA